MLNTSVTSFASFITLAHQMADAAGDILRAVHHKPISIAQKADASPVTQADRAVETALRSLIEAAFPDHGIVGEEFGNSRPESPYQWVLDPIDGTRSFIAGYPLFTTLIALAYQGIPVLGIIDQPILRERWVGIQGEQDGELRGNEMKNAVLATTSTDYFTPRQAEGFAKLKRGCANSVLGGDAYAYAMLASGRIDVVVDAGMKPYDFCALKPVIESSGGVITDWEGKPLTLTSDGNVIAAANRQLHQEALTLLNT